MYVFFMYKSKNVREYAWNARNYTEPSEGKPSASTELQSLRIERELTNDAQGEPTLMGAAQNCGSRFDSFPLSKGYGQPCADLMLTCARQTPIACPASLHHQRVDTLMLRRESAPSFLHKRDKPPQTYWVSSLDRNESLQPALAGRWWRAF